MPDLTNLKFDNSFLNHLEELRKRIIFSIIFLAVLSIFSYFFSNQILSFLIRPVSSVAQKIYYLSPYDAFVVKLQVAFWSGIFLASPLLLTEAWLFIAPGLYVRERKFFFLFIIISIVLFFLGLSIAIFAVIPTTIQFFLSFSTPELLPLISVDQYLSFYVWMALAFGLAFEAPIFLVGLVRFGIVQLDYLKSMRRYVIVGIFVFSAIVTPSPDPFSQCLLAFPLWILFEISLFFSGFLKPGGK